MWCLDDLRTHAIKEADAQVKAMSDIVDAILIARQYRVSHWLTHGYEILGRRQDYLNIDEQERLGLPTAVRLAELREKSWAWHSANCIAKVANHKPKSSRQAAFGSDSTCASFTLPARDGFDFIGAIQSIFEAELVLDRDYSVS